MISYKSGTRAGAGTICGRTRAVVPAGVCMLFLCVVLAGCRPVESGEAGGVRVVSLAPNLTEIVCVLGARDELVGRSGACDYPADVRMLPEVGRFGTPLLEPLLGCRPTLVLDVDLENPAVRTTLRAAGIRSEQVACRRVADIPGAIRLIGGLLGRAAVAEACAAQLEVGLSDCRARRAAEVGPRPRVLVVVWHDPLMTVGARSFVSELVTLAGGENVGDVVARGYYAVSPEWAVAVDPDLVLVLAGGMTGTAVEQLPVLADLPAVRAGRVRVLPDPDVVCRPGPRVLEGIAALERIFGAAAEKSESVETRP